MDKHFCRYSLKVYACVRVCSDSASLLWCRSVSPRGLGWLFQPLARSLAVASNSNSIAFNFEHTKRLMPAVMHTHTIFFLFLFTESLVILSRGRVEVEAFSWYSRVVAATQCRYVECRWGSGPYVRMLKLRGFFFLSFKCVLLNVQNKKKCVAQFVETSLSWFTAHYQHRILIADFYRARPARFP